MPNIGSVGDVYLVPFDFYPNMTLAPNSIMIKTPFNRFYYYFFLSKCGYESILNISQGTTQIKFNKTQLHGLKAIVPPISEQQVIVDYLDQKCSDMDKSIAKRQRSIELLEELKQSVINQAVTRGLNPNVPLKDSGIDWIGKIPSHWKVRPIKFSFILFSGATPKTENSQFWDGDINWLTPADYKTTDHYIRESRKTITKEGLHSCATEVVPQGSLIFSKRAPIGTVALTNIPLCTNQGCISCVPTSDTDSNYYYYFKFRKFTKRH